jgi:type II secretory pathway component PulK
MYTQKNKTGGYLLVVVLVFSAIFMTILTSFVSFIVIQSRLIEQRVQFEQAGQIAEAGLNYYKWYLAHNPNDTTNGTGLPGPYVGV